MFLKVFIFNIFPGMLIGLVPFIVLKCLRQLRFPWHLVMAYILMVSPFFIHGNISEALITLFQLICLQLLIYFFQIWEIRKETMILGIAAAIFMATFVSLLQLGGYTSNIRIFFPQFINDNFAIGEESGRSTGWFIHPNIWASRVLIPSLFLLTIILKTKTKKLLRIYGFLGLFSSLLLTILTGSRTILLAVLIGYCSIVSYIFSNKKYSKKIYIIILLSATSLLIFLVMQTPLGKRLSPQTILFSPISATYNLFLSSEELTYGAWSHPQIIINRKPANFYNLLSRKGRIWNIHKQGNAWWARLQQNIRLAPQTNYIFSAELNSLEEGASIGITGIASLKDYTFLNVVQDEQNPYTWKSQTSDNIEVHSILSEESKNNSWVYLYIFFRFIGDEPVSFNIGPTPDQRSIASGAILQVKSLQIIEGIERKPYQPTFATGEHYRSSLGTIQDRAIYWYIALQGVRSHFLLGNPQNYASYAQENFGINVAHAHNDLLQILYNQGIIGLLGFAIWIIVLIRDVNSRTFNLVIIIILFISCFDNYIWLATVSYPTALFASWCKWEIKE